MLSSFNLETSNQAQQLSSEDFAEQFSRKCMDSYEDNEYPREIETRSMAKRRTEACKLQIQGADPADMLNTDDEARVEIQLAMNLRSAFQDSAVKDWNATSSNQTKHHAVQLQRALKDLPEQPHSQHRWRKRWLKKVRINQRSRVFKDGLLFDALQDRPERKLQKAHHRQLYIDYLMGECMRAVLCSNIIEDKNKWSYLYLDKVEVWRTQWFGCRPSSFKKNSRARQRRSNQD